IAAGLTLAVAEMVPTPPFRMLARRKDSLPTKTSKLVCVSISRSLLRRAWRDFGVAFIQALYDCLLWGMARKFKPVRFFVLMGLAALVVCSVAVLCTHRGSHGRTAEERAAYEIGEKAGEQAVASCSVMYLPFFKGYIINTAQGAANQASITLDSIFRFEFYLPPAPEQEKIAAVLSAYDELIENNQRR